MKITAEQVADVLSGQVDYSPADGTHWNGCADDDSAWIDRVEYVECVGSHSGESSHAVRFTLSNGQKFLARIVEEK